MADLKPQPRRRDPDLLRLLHLSQAKECCLCEANYNLELHHVYPRGQGGDDLRANLVWLCREEHWHVTRNDAATLQRLGAHISRQRPDTIAYLNSKLGDGAADWMRRRLHME